MSQKTKPHHVNGPAVCLACEAKLALADDSLSSWFRGTVKPLHPDCHVSWAFRGKADQNEAYAMGKSKLPWPKSKHNTTPALAIDLFKLESNGMASWIWKYFKKISEEAPAYIKWGGNFTNFSDFSHYELIAEKENLAVQA